MDTSTRRALSVAAGIALAGLVAGTGIASAQDESAATAPAAAAHDHGTSSTAQGTTSAGTEVPAAAGAAAAAPAEACDESELPAHTGFQAGPACVSTPFGEVGAAEDNPQLLIVDAPDKVAVGEAFTLRVSTRNLVRDRFLPAAEGGYYVEPSTLDGNGIVRGHFHTACRVLDGSDRAPQPARQAVFVATEDGAGGATPDTVSVRIPGLPAAGEAQCATWAGDGSHRMPMMAFANQIPAFDAVRISVRGAGAADTSEPADAAPAPAAEAEESEDAAAPTGTGRRTETADATPAAEADEQTETTRSPAAEDDRDAEDAGAVQDADDAGADAGSPDDGDTGTDE